MIEKNLLSRENSLILRGVAILFIMLHNFLHFAQFGFTSENEGSFSSEKAVGFFDAIKGGSNVFGEFLSHLGWIGVPVFVFLTGYGISLTTPPSCCKQISYIKRAYLKLLALMLLGVLFFAGNDLLNGNVWPHLIKRFSYLTMLANFVYPYVNCSPGVYWYFGLTFQFYLLWAFMGRFFNGKNLLIGSVVLLFGLYLVCMLGRPNILKIFKACFTGWFPVFAIGVWLGINKKDIISIKSIWIEILLFIVLLGLILLMGRWLLTWLFVPIVALLWFIIVGMLLMRTRYLSKAFRWIGKFSAVFFVCHPIARLIVNKYLYSESLGVMIILLVYSVLTVILALLYDKLYKWLLSKMLPQTI